MRQICFTDTDITDTDITDLYRMKSFLLSALNRFSKRYGKCVVVYQQDAYLLHNMQCDNVCIYDGINNNCNTRKKCLFII